MLELDLDEDEAAILAEVLENDLSDLRMEIAHTDSWDFRKMLKRRKAILIKALEALEKQAAAVAH